ncbi:MAG TPA: hypothetical protein VNN22_05175 [Verrucomicrobiae bacterium]|nr:hypothetical protein [Verrucomicrobiae bacterium]
MKHRYRTFKRATGIWYCHDNTTGKQSSLRTGRETDADLIVQAKNESLRQPQINIQIAKAYLVAGDPAFASRTSETTSQAPSGERSCDGATSPSEDTGTSP